MAETAGSRFISKNVDYLKSFLKNRGVILDKQRKKDLVLLCQQADKLQLDLDPDGLLEDRSITIQSKLHARDNIVLTLPTLLESSHDISALPILTSFDILHYLSKGRELSEVRKYQNMEGYQMQRDGYVLDLQSCTYPAPESGMYSAIIAKVRPRTNAKDPVSGLPHYICWIILSSHEEDERVISAYCCCRGGIDGFCRHVTAVLFEALYFRSTTENPTTSCTSLPCVWNRPSNWALDPTQAIDAVDLDTSMTNEGSLDRSSKTATNLEKKLDADAFFEGIKTISSRSCCLDSKYVRDKKKYSRFKCGNSTTKTL